MLKELNYASREKDDLHGKALYFCNCFDLILETGEPRKSRLLFCPSMDNKNAKTTEFP